MTKELNEDDIVRFVSEKKKETKVAHTTTACRWLLLGDVGWLKRITKDKQVSKGADVARRA